MPKCLTEVIRLLKQTDQTPIMYWKRFLSTQLLDNKPTIPRVIFFLFELEL